MAMWVVLGDDSMGRTCGEDGKTREKEDCVQGENTNRGISL